MNGRLQRSSTVAFGPQAPEIFSARTDLSPDAGSRIPDGSAGCDPADESENRPSRRARWSQQSLPLAPGSHGGGRIPGGEYAGFLQPSPSPQSETASSSARVNPRQRAIAGGASRMRSGGLLVLSPGVIAVIMADEREDSCISLRRQEEQGNDHHALRMGLRKCRALTCTRQESTARAGTGGHAGDRRSEQLMGRPTRWDETRPSF